MNQWRYMEDRKFEKGRNYIGASDQPTIAGINPNETPMDFWLKFLKREKGFQGNKRTYWGDRMEPIILGEYIYKTTNDRTMMNDFITSRLWGDNRFKDYHSWTECFADGFPRFCSHADMLDMTGDTPVIIQAKNTGLYAAAQRKRDPNKGYDPDDFTANGMPLSVFLQEQWELLTYGIPRAYVAVLIDGWDWQLYGPVEYDKNVVEELAAKSEKMLWHIDTETPPTPQTWGDICHLFPEFEKNTKATISDDAEIECRQMLAQYPKIEMSIKKLEARKDDIKNAIGLYIGGKNYLETATGFRIASASEITGRESISVKELKKYPEIFQAVQSAGLISQSEGYRQLYINGTAAGNIVLYTLLTTADGEKWSKSRKKYTAEEKKDKSDFMDSLKIEYKWEVYES